MAERELDGPPFMTYVDPDEAYLRGQAGSVGSGLLGGWSQATLGGCFGAREGNEAEVRQTIAEIARRRGAPRARVPTGRAHPDSPRRLIAALRPSVVHRGAGEPAQDHAALVRGQGHEWCGRHQGRAVGELHENVGARGVDVAVAVERRELLPGLVAERAARLDERCDAGRKGRGVGGAAWRDSRWGRCSTTANPNNRRRTARGRPRTARAEALSEVANRDGGLRWIVRTPCGAG